VFGLVCAATFSVGLYGSWKIHKGINSAHNSTKDAVDLFDSIKNYTKNISNAARIKEDVESMKISIHKFGDTHLQNFIQILDNYEKVLSNSNYADNQVHEVYNKLANFDVDSVPKMIEKYENIRWIVTICILCLLAIFGFFFTIGVYSRCFLIFFTILGVISLIIVSIIVALSLGASVGVSDFCISAKPFIKSQMNGMIETNIAEYYIECVQKNSTLMSYLDKADDYLKSTQQDIKAFEEINQKLDRHCAQFPDCPQHDRQNIKNRTVDIERNFNATKQTISNLKGLVDCRRVNKDFNDSLNSICTDVIEGIVMILSNVIAASFCFIILVFSATYTFKY
jgi:ABC-type multidrug transport system fused ATPase/permease subunit